MEDPGLSTSSRQMAIQALALTVQDWAELGEGDDPAASCPMTRDVYVDRITALLIVRIVAVLGNPSKRFGNLSTSAICRTSLTENLSWYPEILTDSIVEDVKRFVTFILEHYRDLPFHNAHHAYHVVVSANKLLDLMLAMDSNDFLDDRPPPAFGLRHDPVALLALIFAALIHDVDHPGISNRQLVIEEDPLALRYNDNSINEQHSLHLSFEEFLKDEYKQLRSVMFPTIEEYRYFRLAVVGMVLATDIANPERAQISKSKWKEAFFEEEPNREMIRQHIRRTSMLSDISMPRAPNGGIPKLHSPHNHGQNRRGSTSSIVSDVTMDSYTRLMKSRQKQTIGRDNPPRLLHHRQGSQNDEPGHHHDFPKDFAHMNHRKLRHGEEYSFSEVSDELSPFSPIHKRFISEEMADHAPRLPEHGRNGSKLCRRHSTQSSMSSDSFSSIAQESVDLALKRKGGQSQTRWRKLDRNKFKAIMAAADDSNSSISLTPPSSEEELEEHVPVRGVVVSKSDYSLSVKRPTGVPALLHPRQRTSRRASTGTTNVPVRFGPLTGQRIDEDEVCNSSFRKLSISSKNGNAETERYRKRLGIRRSMDFSGEQIETYSRGSIGGVSLMEGLTREDIVDDEPDELRASVVMELLLRAADVAHGIQSWKNMANWSTCLFQELSVAFQAGRGADPGPGWFDNQTKALESYVLPLSHQLDEIGVFGEFIGAIFSQKVESNRDNWLIKGFDLTLSLRGESME